MKPFKPFPARPAPLTRRARLALRALRPGTAGLVVIPLLSVLLAAVLAVAGAQAGGLAAAPAPAKPAGTATSATPPAIPTKAAVGPGDLPPVAGEALAHTCAACHGTHGRLGDEAFMPLAGMPVAQFVSSMQDFRSGERPATLMGLVARGLTDADLQAMAQYFVQQKPAPGSAAALLPAPFGAPR
jgi:sulfide dehydrogenase cytochrome subunit